MRDTADELAGLCRELGAPERDLAILAEGNASLRVDERLMLVKASGTSLADTHSQDLVTVDYVALMPLLDDGAAEDESVADAYRRATQPGVNGYRKPSVEAILHAVLYRETDAAVVAHTHPTAVNALLCSQSADLLVAGALFPDQIVVLGRRNLLVPYVDPGLPLARAVRAALRAFRDETGTQPRVIYLVNHGLFALGRSSADALQVTLMAVKAARVLHGAILAGGPVFLDDAHADRIERRPDELYRRGMLDERQGSRP